MELAYRDLRDYIEKTKKMGECRVVEGADWDLEIGTVSAWQGETGKSPLLLFDNIKGYPAGYRVATNLFNTPKRIALALGLSKPVEGMDLVKAWRDRDSDSKMLPPVEVATGPIKENVHTGKDVDVYEFPTPRWHELDGGRYIGTAHMVVTRDPDEGWVNFGAYRTQIQDKTTVTIHMNNSKHAGIMRRKYWAKGLSCPIAIVIGEEPMLWAASYTPLPWGVSEYDYAGFLKGSPIEVTRGVTTDLPIPASAEIVLEGEMPPPEVDSRQEGPFGEWTGCYAGGKAPVPVMKIKSILHRNNPILMGAPPSKFVSHYTLARDTHRAAAIWDELDAKLPGIKGVWNVDDAGGMPIVIVSVHQLYAGHAMQVGLSVASGIVASHQISWIIIVDDDIDPSNISEVLWAMGQRCDPEIGIHVIPQGRTSRLKPSVSAAKKASGDLTQGMAIIFACTPYTSIKDAAPRITISDENLRKAKEKWGKLFERA